jgi:hypothetical protein
MKMTGSCMVFINSDYLNGPTGIFCISRSNFGKTGCVITLSSSPGDNGEYLDIKCEANQYPSIMINNFDIHKSKFVSILLTVQIIYPPI